MMVPSVAVPIAFTDIVKVMERIFTQDIRVSRAKFKQGLEKTLAVKESAIFHSGMDALCVLLKSLAASQPEKKEVIIPAYTCPTVLIAVENAGLVPVFADININTFCIDPLKTVEKISNNTLAVIVAHMFGAVTDISTILKSKAGMNFSVIEDFCQTAMTDVYNPGIISQRGDFAILSFGRAKMLSTINGGAVVTYKDEYVSAVRELDVQNGIYDGGFFCDMKYIFKMSVFGLAVRPVFYCLADKVLARKRSSDKFNLKAYRKISSNSGLCNAQYILGAIMLDRLKSMNGIRKKNGSYYLSHMADKDVFLQDAILDNYYLRFAAVFKDKRFKKKVTDVMKSSGMKLSTGDYPVLSTVAGTEACTEDARFPIASLVASDILLFPTHPMFDAWEYNPFKNLER